MTELNCPVCNAEHGTASALRDHAWDAHDACHYCGETFDEKEALYVHWLATHEDELSRADQKRAEHEIGELTVGDRLAHQGPKAAVKGMSRRSLLIGGGAALATGGAATVGGVFGGSSTKSSDIYQKSEAPTGTSVGQKIPDFTLKTTDGGTVSLLPAAKPTIIFFMAAWCSSCRFEEKNLKNIHDKYGDSVRIISVDVDPRRDSMADLQQFQSTYGGGWIHAMGTEDLLRRYQLHSLDVTYLLNEHGITVYKDESITEAATLDNHLSKLTGKQAGGMPSNRFGELGSAHWHADFMVVINGDRVDFSKDKYMVQSRYVHFENGDGTTIHKHATGVPLAYFFKTIGWNLTNECLTTDTGTSYCTGEGGTLRIIVNGEEIDNPQYKFKDADTTKVIYE